MDVPVRAIRTGVGFGLSKGVGSGRGLAFFFERTLVLTLSVFLNFRTP
jgi:hypothetical protein